MTCTEIEIKKQITIIFENIFYHCVEDILDAKISKVTCFLKIPGLSELTLTNFSSKLDPPKFFFKFKTHTHTVRESEGQCIRFCWRIAFVQCSASER